jgi:hypothetical protein
MNLTTILSISESVEINDHRLIGQTLSRNQRITTSEILTVQPFEFIMQPMKYLLYSQNRGLLSTLRQADRNTIQVLHFPSTGWLNYVKYQGDMTGAQIEAAVWTTASAGQTLVLGTLPTMPSTSYIVRTGDFCQVGQYAYIATADVQRGTGSTVSIPVHRTLLNPVGTGIGAVIGEFGTTVPMAGTEYLGVAFQVVLRDYPTYQLMPYANDSYINWTGQFRALEIVQ